ncbi:MAG: CvpA family protein [Peptostreptococcaceae bacterium]|nr:CvpA family protein [Peptostreptococcaceae bacterium]
MGTKLDGFIMLFILFHMIRGYLRGFSKSFFLSLRFLVSAGLSSWLFAKYSETMMNFEPVRVYIEAVERFLQTFLSPLIYEALQLRTKILWFSLLVLIGLLLGLLFELMQENIEKKALRGADKSAGVFFGAFKALLYLMLVVALLDKPIQKMAVVELQDLLSASRLLKYLYAYNIFLDFFS